MSDYNKHAGNRSKTAASRQVEYAAAPLWHNLLYALVSTAVIFGPLFVPGVTFVDVFLALEGGAVVVFMLLLLAGMFHVTALFRRQEQRARHQRH